MCVVGDVDGLEEGDRDGSAEEVQKELKEKVGLSQEVGKRITDATTAKTLDEFAELAGVGDSPEVQEMRQLFKLAKDYGFGDCVVAELLKEKSVVPTLPQVVDYVVAPYNA